jgi:hypothetical protein
MQKMIILILLGMLICSPLKAQDSWQTEKIDDWFEVSFPGVAEQVDTFDQRLLYLEQDSLVFFVSKAKGETPNVTDRHKLAEYYDGLVNGFVDQTGSKLMDEADFQMESVIGREIRVEFSYASTSNSFGPMRDSSSVLQTDSRKVKFLLLNGHTYVLQFWMKMPENAGKKEIGKQFFESFQAIQPISKEMQYAEKPAKETDANPWLGEGLMYVGMVLLIAFVYMLGRWVARSKRF